MRHARRFSHAHPEHRDPDAGMGSVLAPHCRETFTRQYICGSEECELRSVDALNIGGDVRRLRHCNNKRARRFRGRDDRKDRQFCPRCGALCLNNYRTGDNRVRGIYGFFRLPKSISRVWP